LGLCACLCVFFSVFVYMDRYPSGDCDDKAVHYYSSACFWSSGSKLEDIKTTIPAWIEKESSLEGKQRVFGRLVGYNSYIAADILIKYVKNYLVHHSSSVYRTFTYGTCVKTTFLIMYMIALIYIIVLGSRSSMGVWPTLVIVILAAANTLWTSYRVAGSAALLIPALFLSYSDNKKICFLLSAALLLCWHVAIAIPVFFILGITLAATEILLHKLNSEKSNWWFIDVFSYSVSILLICVCAIIAMRKFFYAMPLETVFYKGQFLLNPFHFPIEILKRIIRPALLVILTYTVLKTHLFKIRELFYMKLFLGSSLFLIFTKIFCLLFKFSFFQNLLISLTKNNLIREIPGRLFSSYRMVLLLFIISVVWYIACRLQKYTRDRSIYYVWNISVFLTVMSLVIMMGVTVLKRREDHKLMFTMVSSDYFRPDCAGVHYIPIQKNTLTELDPNAEPEFFYSLGEYLFNAS